MERNNGWREVDTKSEITSYLYEHNGIRCTILEPGNGKVPIAVELVSRDLDRIHYFYFHASSRNFLSHLETSGSSETTKQNEDLSLLVEHKEIFQPTSTIPIIYSIREIIEANQ